MNAELDFSLIVDAEDIRSVSGCFNRLGLLTATDAVLKNGRRRFGERFNDIVDGFPFSASDTVHRAWAAFYALGQLEGGGITALAIEEPKKGQEEPGTPKPEEQMTVDGRYQQMFKSAAEREYPQVAKQYLEEKDPDRKKRLGQRLRELHEQP